MRTRDRGCGGALEESWVSDSNLEQFPPLPEQGSLRPMPGGTCMCKVALGGGRGYKGSKWHTASSIPLLAQRSLVGTITEKLGSLKLGEEMGSDWLWPRYTLSWSESWTAWKARHLWEGAVSTHGDFSQGKKKKIQSNCAGTMYAQPLDQRRWRSRSVICSHLRYLIDWSNWGSRGSKRQRLPERLLPIVELSGHAGTLRVCSTPQGQGGYNLLPLSAPHRLIQGSKNEVDYHRWPGTSAKSRRCRPHSALRAWPGKWVPVIIVTQTEPPSLQSQVPSACRSWEDLQNWFDRRKILRRLFLFLFFLKSKTKDLELQKTRVRSRKKSEGKHQQLRQSSLCYPSELECCGVFLISHLLVYLGVLFCFILPSILHFNFSHFMRIPNNTLLLVFYFLFFLFRLYISYHTIVISNPTHHPPVVFINFSIFRSFITIAVNYIFSHTTPSFYLLLSLFLFHLTPHKLSSFLSQLTFFFPSTKSLISFSPFIKSG